MKDRRERRNPRHPEVGRAPAPNFSKVTSKIGSRDRKHVPKPSNVKIFNDTAYTKAAKVNTIWFKLTTSSKAITYNWRNTVICEK